MKLKKIIYFLTYSIFLLNCTSNKSMQETFVAKTCIQNFNKINFKSIIDSASFYNKRFIEISGYYHSETEQSSISENRKDERPRIWIEVIQEIADSLHSKSPNENAFAKINGKRITIRGNLDTGNHGHLGQYILAIKNVCYLKILD